mmetsp:Transcript_42422/g.79621  ORF Transcript_42422/g.79621 Transcript_42422/m.79621 type:complete len:545 (-) Transcript_42422:75-1709(-)
MEDCPVCAGSGLLAVEFMDDECPLCDRTGHLNTVEGVDLPSAGYRGTGLVYTTSHNHACEPGKHMLHLEGPERVSRSLQMLEQEGLRCRCVEVPSCEVGLEDLYSIHSERHLEEMEGLEYMETQAEVDAVASNYESLYFTNSSFTCARTAAGSVVALVERVVRGELSNGFALVRPPGHHAEADHCCGWCIFNNVAVAADVARKRLGLERILIVDWDVHHGNGIQHLFEEDSSIMYFSVHRYDDGGFFPFSKDAAPNVVGCGPGAGFNVNVAWNLGWKDKKGMGDDEYFAAWQCVLLPIAREFNPQLVLVSAGFDAAQGDLGGCSVTPAGFAQMTRMLQSVCPKTVLVLEGGYDLGVVPLCVCACTRALLGDSLSLRAEVKPKMEARFSIERTWRAHRCFWTSLDISGALDLISKDVIALDVAVSATPLGCSDTLEVRQSKVPGRRHGKEKRATGVSIATRNAAVSNWKNDLKKLNRKQTELKAGLDKISSLKTCVRKGTKVSKKDYALLETEDDLMWQLKEVIREVQELSLSEEEAIRMYTGRP